MGSSSEGNKGIHVSAGGLVWVRRRNGKWWPGRILGPEEVPENCVASPRLGTPVKLLGREDASVDWYNLEKSKRVKAFRCGEYDECIEKAKATAANSSKKLMKNARRADAILHALEIESAHLAKDHPDFYLRLEKQDEEEHTMETSPSSFNPHEGEIDNMEEDSSNSDDDSDLAQELSQSGVSFEDLNHTGASKEKSVQGRQRQTPNDSEDDGTEGVKRMKGLGDLGMGVVSSLKRKRAQVAHVHEFLKRKHRRRTLAKVLESSAMLSVPVMCKQLAGPTSSLPPGASDNELSGLKSDESKKSFSVVNKNNFKIKDVSCENVMSFNASEHTYDASLVERKQKEKEISSTFSENGSSDRLYDVPFVAEEKQLAGLGPVVCNASQAVHVGPGTQSTESNQAETVSLRSEELNESGSTSSGTAKTHISQRVDNGTSKWQLKGKRSRHISKNKRQDSGRSIDADDECDAYLDGTEGNADYNTFGGSLASDNSTYRVKSKAVAEIQVDEYRGWSRNASHKESYVNWATPELQTPQRLLPCRRSRFNINPKYEDFSLRHHTAVSSLFDVNLKVKASYRPQHVPYVSLMSKFSGRPIVGHPLMVEVLDDSFCDNLMNGSECYSSSCELGEDLSENTSAMGGVELGYEARSNSAGSIPSKHTLQPRVSPTKSPKMRRNGFLLKKIRKLSSLTGAHKQSEQENKMVVEKLKGPAVACVPLKVVFSRINAALNSSTRPAHRFSAPSNA